MCFTKEEFEMLQMCGIPKPRSSSAPEQVLSRQSPACPHHRFPCSLPKHTQLIETARGSAGVTEAHVGSHGEPPTVSVPEENPQQHLGISTGNQMVPSHKYPRERRGSQAQGWETASAKNQHHLLSSVSVSTVTLTFILLFHTVFLVCL